MKVFYVLPVSHPKASAHLDGLRFICNPREKTLTHITVRGPYRQRYRLCRANKQLTGLPIEVKQAGTFFTGRQNTVFLHAHSEALRLVWHKPDYPEFNPHVTIYDGPSRDFAASIFSLLNDNPISFAFRAGELEALVTSRGQIDSFLRLKLNLRLLSHTIGHALSIDRVIGADDTTRLYWAAEIIRHLSRLSQSISIKRKSTQSSSVTATATTIKNSTQLKTTRTSEHGAPRGLNYQLLPSTLSSPLERYPAAQFALSLSALRKEDSSHPQSNNDIATLVS